MNIKRKIYFWLVIFLGISAALIVFLIYPILKDIDNNSKELISQKQEVASLENEMINVEEFKKNYQEKKLNLDKVETLLIEPELPIGFINFLETNATSCQLFLEILSYSQTKKTNQEPWSSLLFQISSTGSFSNFLKFFEKLETSNFLIEIMNLHVSRLGEKTGQISKGGREFSPSDVEVNFSLKVYTK